MTTLGLSKGTIRSLKDGIAEIYGLSFVQAGELVESLGNFGLVLNLQRTHVGAIFLSEHKLVAGSIVKRLFELMNIGVTSSMLSRVVDALGEDVNLSVITNAMPVVLADSVTRPVELGAPSIIDRQSVYESLVTGSKIVDSIVPIGLGQRELVIGDRQTGKTAIVIDSILLGTQVD
jgi:F-type H+-transporting ATPase subunit alpha